jgi:hypothetical protein
MTTTTLTIGKRLLPLEHIALFEPYAPAEHSRMQSERPFKTRIVLIDRDSVLSEEPLGILAERHAFRVLTGDDVATNPAIHFKVEAFEPREGFTPRKSYRSRLLWRDHDGEPQSKLLVTEPEKVLAVAVRGEPPGPVAETDPPPRTRRRRRSASTLTPV